MTYLVIFFLFIMYEWPAVCCCFISFFELNISYSGWFFPASVVVFIRAAVDPQIYFQAPWTKENPVITKTYSETDRVNYQVLALTATDPVVPETVQTYRKVNASDPNNNFYIDGRK